MPIIAGLGNPGKKYERTRHNAGFMAVEALAEQYGAEWRNQKKFQALVAEARGMLLLKPMTFMNNSGIAVGAALSYYKLLPKKLGFTAKGSDLSENLTVIHDDKDLPLGEYRVSVNSGSAGHKGVQSIIDHVKTKNFKRIRLGVAAPHSLNTAEFVLQNFSDPELNTISEVIKTVLEKEIDI